jgi:hypothetical protein
MIDEESVGDERSAEDAAGFEVAEGVWVCEVEECLTEFWGKKDGSEWCARFGEGVWFEGVPSWGSEWPC